MDHASDYQILDSKSEVASGDTRCSLRCFQRWQILSCCCRAAIIVSLIFAVLVVTVGVALGTIYLQRKSRHHVPSPGNGRYIPPWLVYPGPYNTSDTTQYPAPSPLYDVSVSFVFWNGTTAAPATSAFVYFNSIEHRSMDNGADAQRPGQSVSWTGFSFDDNLVYADVTVRVGTPFTGCVLRPLSYNLSCEIVPGSSSVRICILRSPLKISVELYSAELKNSESFVSQPLFLFPDAPEDPALVPSPHDTGVLYYNRGVHNLSGQLAVPCGTNNVYLEPGVFISRLLSELAGFF